MSAFASLAMPPASKRQKVEGSQDVGVEGDDDDLLAAYSSRAQDAIRLEFARPSFPGPSQDSTSFQAASRTKVVLNSVAP